MSGVGWPAPTPVRPVTGTVALPGSKSATNRALVLAALAETPSTLVRPLRSRDTDLMAAGLRALGTTVIAGADGWRVEPRRLRGPAQVACGLAGTVMRFLPAVAGLADGPVAFDGEPRARQRPMKSLVQALRDLGVRVDDAGRGGLPLTVVGRGRMPGGSVTLDASTSSQFVSALLLVGPRLESPLTVHHCGPPLPSAPHVAMTVGFLRARGVVVDDGEPDRWVVEPGAVAGGDVVVEPDLSNGAAFLAAALVTGGRVTVSDWPGTTLQPGEAVRGILAAFGAQVELHPGGLTVTGTGVPAGVDLDLRALGELAPVVAAVCALADGPSQLRGIGHLRGHESDRLTALADGIGRLGGMVEQTADGLRVEPRPLHGGPWPAHDDHRLAQAGAVLGLVVPGIVVDQVTATAKTMPDFPQRWAALVAR